MYRINLYPEHLEKRREVRRGVARTSLFTAILGVEFLLVASLGLTGLLIREQADTLRGEAAELSQRAERGPTDEPELAVGREILRLREERIEWAPKLAVLSRSIDRRLRLSELEGRIGIRRQTPSLELKGEILPGGSMQTVFGFVDELQSDSWISEDFPEIKLGNLEGGGASRFLLVCEPTRKAS
jgi:hypothetical protein